MGTDQISGRSYLLAQNIISVCIKHVVEASVVKVPPLKGSVDLILIYTQYRQNKK